MKPRKTEKQFTPQTIILICLNLLAVFGIFYSIKTNGNDKAPILFIVYYPLTILFTYIFSTLINSSNKIIKKFIIIELIGLPFLWIIAFKMV